MTPERRLQILTGTRGLLDNPARWGQFTMIHHPVIDRLLMRPAKLCLVAAISAVIHGIDSVVGEGLIWDQEVSDVHDYLWELVGSAPLSPHVGRQLMTWNDMHTYPEVIALLDLGILETWLELTPDQPDHGADNEQHDQDRQEHARTIPPNG